LARQSAAEQASGILHHRHPANLHMHFAHGRGEKKSWRPIVCPGVHARVLHRMRRERACCKITRMSFDIRQMRRVAAVADHGSFGRENDLEVEPPQPHQTFFLALCAHAGVCDRKLLSTGTIVTD